ncbi:MAG: acyl-CoA ligase (AMP-forming), exosortase A system-associated [Actinomycetales bacterium]
MVGLHDLLHDAARRHPKHSALTYADNTLTYQELWSAVHRTACGLRALGIDRGDRVAVYLDKRLETVISLFAAAAAGAVFVPINPALRATQAAHIMRDCQASILVTSQQRWQALSPSEQDQLAVILVDQDPAHVVAPGPRPVTSWSDVSAAEPLPLPPMVETDLASLLYTSGSTGSPKGVALTHRNLVAGAQSVSSYLLNTHEDVILALLPLSFDAGFSQLSTAFAVGAHVVLMNYLVPGDVPKACARHGVTGLTCVPPLWIQIANLTWPRQARAQLRYFASTGGRMPKQILDQLRLTFPEATPYLMYGLTEAFRSTYLDPAEIDRRPDSIGKAIPNAEILVVAPDGSLCGPGQEGELVHRGPLVALGYWNDPERTAQRFRPLPGPVPQWRQPELAVWSGDTVTLDEQGFLYFVGRQDDMIKTSGYRVSPTEVEEAAYQTGLVQDAVALGIEDERLGQRIVLVVTPGADFDVSRFTTALRATLPSFMVPSQIEVRDCVPRSPNGKFDRVHLRAELTP